MATLHNFYLAPECWQAPFILTGPEAHHLDKVLRLKEGTTVRIFDGQGRFGFFTIDKKEKNKITLHQTSEAVSEKPAARHTLAAGFCKGLRRGWFLEKAVELEADALWFWQGDYSQSTLPEKEKSTWTATLISGAKQCESPWLPSLQMLPRGVEELAEKRKHFSQAFLLYEGETKGRIVKPEDFSLPGDTLLVVGPEGGFSPREVDVLIKADFTAVSLGNRVLRWETAAIMALGIAWWARQ